MKSDLLQQVKAGLLSSDGGYVINEWRSVTLTQDNRSIDIEAFYPSDTRANIRLRRPVVLRSGKYYEIFRFNKRGELVSESLVETR